MDSSLIILHLSLIEGIGPAAIQLIVDKKPSQLPWHDLYDFTARDLIEIFGFSSDKAQKIVSGLSNNSLLESELQLLEQHQINWTTVVADNYPELLKHIYLPPAILYWQGQDLRCSEQSIAIVGSRAMNWYGKCAIEQLVPSLVKYGWSIVSGGAVGVDSYAHQIAVEANGRTIVVLGSGICNPYPLCNKKLFESVIKSGGTLLSSFPLHTVARPGNFPARNRIIAGLSRGCVVVQAAQKSGARITARFALEQGRDVFAVPGPINDELTAGCHELIKEGAKLVHCADDILEEYGQVSKQSDDKCNVKKVLIEKSDPITEKIVNYCSRLATVDELAEVTGLSNSALYERLFELQLQGAIYQQMGLWRRY